MYAYMLRVIPRNIEIVIVWIQQAENKVNSQLCLPLLRIHSKVCNDLDNYTI